MSDEDSSDTRFFHGGPRGLAVGDEIVPAEDLAVPSVSGDGGAPYRRDRVYLTKSELGARAYAAVYVPPEVIAAWQADEKPPPGSVLGGAVYEVEALGEIEEDPDDRGFSWQATKARVIRVVRQQVPPDPEGKLMVRARKEAAAVPVLPAAQPTPPMPLNSPCSCGSGKKFKLCHGQEWARRN